MTSKQIRFHLPHDVLYGRADFLVAPSNAAAIEMIDRWPDWPYPVLVLIGGEACGKTHLAHIWQARSQARSLYKLSEPSQAAFLAADDIDRNLDRIGEARLFALLNQIMRQPPDQSAFLMTASTMSWWRHVQMADLRSRLASSAAIEIAPPDEELISALLVKLFADRQLYVSESLIAWLVPRMERSFAAARHIVAELDRKSAEQSRPITIALARAALF